MNEIKHNRIITVFGCGGDRDRSKRPLMGEVSAMFSDFTIITSDNPRSESAERILLDIEVGFQRKKNRNYEIVVDRASAIKRAVDMCMPDDILIIAGKGHEDYFIIGNERLHFSDKETAENMLLEKYGKNRNK